MQSSLNKAETSLGAQHSASFGAVRLMQVWWNQMDVQSHSTVVQAVHCPRASSLRDTSHIINVDLYIYFDSFQVF